MTDGNKKVMDSVASKHEKIQVELIGVIKKVTELEKSGIAAPQRKQSQIISPVKLEEKTNESPTKSIESPTKPVEKEQPKEEPKAPEPIVEPPKVEAPPKVPTPQPSPEKPAEVEELPIDTVEDDGGAIDFANLGGGGMTDEEKEEILGKLTEL